MLNYQMPMRKDALASLAAVMLPKLLFLPCRSCVRHMMIAAATKNFSAGFMQYWLIMSAVPARFIMLSD